MFCVVNVTLFDYIDKEAEKKMMPIGIHDLAIGYTHAFAVLDNVITQNAASDQVIVTHGRDVLSW